MRAAFSLATLRLRCLCHHQSHLASNTAALGHACCHACASCHIDAGKSAQAVIQLGGPNIAQLSRQNPPAIPALPLAVLVSRLRRARLVVDWHNYGIALPQA